MLVGHIDECSRTRLRGWIRDASFSDAPVCLLVVGNDRFLGRVVANQHRPDVETAGHGNGRSGFDLRFEPPLSPVLSWTIHVRSEVTGGDIPGSPFRIDPASDFDDAAREAFAAAITAAETDAEIEGRVAYLGLLRDRLVAARVQRVTRPGSRPMPCASGSTSVRARPQALVLDATPPTPDQDAGSVAIMSHMASLGRLGFIVTFACPAMSVAGSEDVLSAAGISWRVRPWFETVEEMLRKEAGLYALVYVHRVSIAAAYMVLIRRHQPRARVLYSVADLHHVRIARQSKVEERPELLAEARRIRLLELWACEMADAVITHSDAEAAYLRRRLPARAIHVVPWAVEIHRVSADFSDRTGIAFVGNFHHAPNLDAARQLRDVIMPQVHSADPHVICELVGTGLPSGFQTGSNGIRHVGHLPKLIDIFERVRLTVAPLRFGAGIKGKVIESLAAGIPCVCTPIAAEGLGIHDDLRRLMVSDTSEIVELILTLHSLRAENERAVHLGLDYVRRQNVEDRLDGLMLIAVARYGTVFHQVV